MRRALGRGSKRLEALINVLRRREFPAYCCVSEANQETIDFVAGTQSRVIAEIGVYQGHTSELFARYLGGRGELHLFDFEERVREVAAKLEAAGYRNVVSHANSHKTMDSYNWSLMRVLQAHPEPIYDYVLLDLLTPGSWTRWHSSWSTGFSRLEATSTSTTTAGPSLGHRV